MLENRGASANLDRAPPCAPNCRCSIHPLAGPNTGRELIEMVVYAGLPPAMPSPQDERDKKNKLVQWLRSNEFMVATKDGFAR